DRRSSEISFRRSRRAARSRVPAQSQPELCSPTWISFPGKNHEVVGCRFVVASELERRQQYHTFFAPLRRRRSGADERSVPTRAGSRLSSNLQFTVISSANSESTRGKTERKVTWKACVRIPHPRDSSPMIDPRYLVRDPSELLSPSLLIYPKLVRQNVEAMIAMARGPERLRPHVKTHKMAEIVRLAESIGIHKHKCATIAEAEMVAAAG